MLYLPKNIVYIWCLCLFISSMLCNVSFYSHHSTENNFSKVTSKIPIASCFQGQTSLLYLTSVISPLWETPGYGLSWHFTLLILFLLCLLNGLLVHHLSPLNDVAPLALILGLLLFCYYTLRVLTHSHGFYHPLQASDSQICRFSLEL